MWAAQEGEYDLAKEYGKLVIENRNDSSDISLLEKRLKIYEAGNEVKDQVRNRFLTEP